VTVTNTINTNQKYTFFTNYVPLTDTNFETTNVPYTNQTINVLTNAIPEIVALSYTNTNVQVIALTNYSISVSNTIVTNILSTNIISTNQIGSGGGYNYYDGYWNAKLQNQYPNQVFNGNGAVSLGQSGDPTDPSPINRANGTATVRQITFSVQGTRVSGSTSQIY
jgi:hypothetical protein